MSDLRSPMPETIEAVHSRRVLLSRSATGLAALAGAGALAAPAVASGPGKHHWKHRQVRSDFDFIVTQEQFGVTVLTEAIRRAPGTPSEQFLPVLKAANTTEFDHVTALEAVGARPLTTSYWIPDAAVGAGGGGPFASLPAGGTGGRRRF